MGGGMVRDVDRAIGAISTLVVGVGLIALREFLRGDKSARKQWQCFELSEDGKDIYYQKKYGAPKMPLFQHRGSCDCGALGFLILAPKRVDAFDDSNTLSCKKGRFPYLLLPTGCFEMVHASDVSVYDPPSTSASTQHVFCGKCGVHIFHFDHAVPELVAVNLYCVDGDSFDDVKINFVPKGSRPLIGVRKRSPMPVEQVAYRQSLGGSLELEHNDSESSTISFQKQLMLWARLDKQRAHSTQGSDDTQSSTSVNSQGQRISLASEDPVPLMDMKEQLQFYLKRHVDNQELLDEEEQTDV